MKKKVIETDSAPQAIGPYSQAVRAGDTLYCSGQVALDPETMELVGERADEQTEQVLRNIGQVLKAAGRDFSHVVKCSIYLSDMEDFQEVNRIYGRVFGDSPPARETVAVKALPKGAKVEISCIAIY